MILYVLIDVQFKGIQNLKCAVMPLGKSKEAFSDKATHNTILFYA